MASNYVVVRLKKLEWESETIDNETKQLTKSLKKLIFEIKKKSNTLDGRKESITKRVKEPWIFHLSCKYLGKHLSQK